MAAVVTTEFIAQIIKDTKETFNSGLYIGLGRSETWGAGETPASPQTSFEYARESRGSTQHVKIVTGVSAAVARQDWSSDTIYQPYDDSSQTAIPYVMNSKYEFFLCIEQGYTDAGIVIPSDVEPDRSLINGGTGVFSDPIQPLENEFVTLDSQRGTGGYGKGYTWRYLFTLSQVAINRFLTLNYIPVSTFTQDPLDQDVETEQYEIQQVNKATYNQSGDTTGQVLNIKVIDGGAGYSGTNTTATVVGDGTGATAIVSVVGGVIQTVRVTNRGTGYSVASVVIEDTSIPSEDATLRVVLGPNNGIEADPIKTLKAESLLVTTDFEDDEFSTLFTANDFRQVILFKDPTDYNSSNLFTANTGKANRALRTTGVTNIQEDNIIAGDTSGAKAIVDHIDGNDVYIHQTAETGYANFRQGEVITDQDTAGNATLINGPVDLGSFVQADQIDPDLDVYSGEILYINNIAPIDRDPNQTEDIKIIISF